MLDLDKWIGKVKKCEALEEEELKSLCEHVKEILVEESNVQPVNAPVTVRTLLDKINVAKILV